ncbi:ABC transporter permease subunit [Saccharophagus sp. K07]|jgi:oligopeptide transport system permease protein|uniref:ABC transporter permease n=1 Tax=Saccharophagus sp. K07 TaxID=2283636 RepID=UPI0016523583|nr:ABC transporter permease subunit [Saccharophagus sp. K07]MBC6906952.1 ABC transporter permease subunit [Saccharophagus sp. K07]
MLRIFLQRCLSAIPVLFLVVLFTFILIRLAPGGPFDDERAVPPQVLENLNKRYHLDDPIHVQFFDYVKHLLQGDFGPSFKYPSRTVTEVIYAGIPVTLELSLYAFLVALVFGITSGVIASLKPNTLQDYVPMSAAMIGICLPSFVLGPLLILVFGIQLDWLPVSGWGVTPGDKILPSITLGAGYAAYLARLSRGGMLETLSQDYIRTARAKGLSGWRVVFHHALRGALAPVVSFAGPAVAGLLSGSFVVETIYQIPGLGRFYLQAAFNRDYTMILGMTILFAFLIIICNLLADLLLLWLNPKLRGRK